MARPILGETKAQENEKSAASRILTVSTINPPQTSGFRSFWSKHVKAIKPLLPSEWLPRELEPAWTKVRHNRHQDLIAASHRPVSFATSAAKSFSESPPWQASLSTSLLKLQYLSDLVQICTVWCHTVSYAYFFVLSYIVLPSSSSTRRPFEHSETCPPVLPALPATTATGSRTLEATTGVRMTAVFRCFHQLSQAVDRHPLTGCWQASSLSTLAKFSK